MMAFKPIISIPSLAVQTSFNDIYWSTILSNTLHTVGMIILSPFFSESSVNRQVESSSKFFSSAKQAKASSLWYILPKPEMRSEGL